MAAAVLVLGGGMQRWHSSVIAATMAETVQLDPPLASLPMNSGAWRGEDLPISEGTLRIAGNDDYVNRRYVHAQTGEFVHLYVAYTARPRTMLRHRPSVCYPSAGWAPVAVTTAVLHASAADSDRALETPGETSEERGTLSTQTGVGSDDPASVASQSDTQFPVRMSEFYRPGVPEQRIVVLNYYVLNGVPTIDEHSFWSLGWRTPNLARDASRYVAQVQISVPVTAGVDSARGVLERFAARTAADILRLLPAVAGSSTQ